MPEFAARLRSFAARTERGSALLLSLAASSCQSSPSAPPTLERAEQLRAEQFLVGKFSSQAGNLDVHYRLFVPPERGASERYPLIVFLHGAGSHGTDNLRHLTPAVSAIVERAQAIEPTFVLAPQDPTGEKWVSGSGQAPYRNYRQVDRAQSAATGLLLAGIDELVKAHPLDPDRIYLTGVSAGGTGTWDLVTRDGTRRFAAAVPINGANDPSRATQLSQTPIWAFHGALDDIAPVSNSREMVARLQSLGSPVRYTEYPDLGHDIVHRAYSEAELFSWLLATRRVSPTTPR